MDGRAMPTTVASMAAMPEPSTVAVTTHRPCALDSRRPGLPASATAVWLMRFPPGLLADHARGVPLGPFGISKTFNLVRTGGGAPSSAASCPTGGGALLVFWSEPARVASTEPPRIRTNAAPMAGVRCSFTLNNIACRLCSHYVGQGQ